MQDRSEAGAARGLLTRLGLSIFCTMNVMAFTMALWTTDVYGPASPRAGCSIGFQGLFRYIVLLFSLPVLGLLGIPLFTATWQSVRQGLVSTDALLSLGVGAAFASSFLAVLQGEGTVYFEVGCVILVMTSLGRWLEVEGRLKATEALDALASLLPATVRRVGSLQEEELVPLDQVKTGDVLRVLPGETVSRGRVRRGQLGPGRRAGLDRREQADPQGTRGGDSGRHARPRWRPADPGERGRQAERAGPPGRDGQRSADDQRALSTVGRPDLDLVRSAGGCGRSTRVRRPRGPSFVRAGASRRAGREPHRLPVRSGPGNSPGRLECDRPGREPPGPVSKRRSARASGRCRARSGSTRPEP